MSITDSNNFCRIFELPLEYPEGFCFGGGKPVTFTMVDWFNPIPSTDIWNNTIKPWSEYVPLMLKFLQEKLYVKSGRKYILITDFGESMVFSKNV
jgi:hypothetical protein